MFQYYDEERKVKSCEPVSIRDFISQPDGDVWGWFNEYIKYGGITEIHDIVPYYELKEKYHAEEVKENCHAMKLLGPDCRKIIVTEPDEETVSKIRYNCPDNVDVMDIISFLGR